MNFLLVLSFILVPHILGAEIKQSKKQIDFGIEHANSNDDYNRKPTFDVIFDQTKEVNKSIGHLDPTLDISFKETPSRLLLSTTEKTLFNNVNRPSKNIWSRFNHLQFIKPRTHSTAFFTNSDTRVIPTVTESHIRSQVFNEYSYHTPSLEVLSPILARHRQEVNDNGDHYTTQPPDSLGIIIANYANQDHTGYIYTTPSIPFPPTGIISSSHSIGGGLMKIIETTLTESATPTITTSDGFDGTLNSKEKQDTTQPTDSPKIGTSTSAHLDFTGYNYTTPSIPFPPTGIISSSHSIGAGLMKVIETTLTESATPTITTSDGFDGTLNSKEKQDTTQPTDSPKIGTSTSAHLDFTGYNYTTPSIPFPPTGIISSSHSISAGLMKIIETTLTESATPTITTSDGFDGTLNSKEKQDTTQPTDSPKIGTSTSAHLDFTGYNYTTPSIPFPPTGIISSSHSISAGLMKIIETTLTESATPTITTSDGFDGTLNSKEKQDTTQPTDSPKIGTSTSAHLDFTGYNYTTPSIPFPPTGIISSSHSIGGGLMKIIETTLTESATPTITTSDGFDGTLNSKEKQDTTQPTDSPKIGTSTSAHLDFTGYNYITPSIPFPPTGIISSSHSIGGGLMKIIETTLTESATPTITTSDGFDGTLNSKEKQDTTQPTDSPKIGTSTSAHLDFTGYNYTTPSIPFPPTGIISSSHSGAGLMKIIETTLTESATPTITTSDGFDGTLNSKEKQDTTQPTDSPKIGTSTSAHLDFTGYNYTTPSIPFPPTGIISSSHSIGGGLMKIIETTLTESAPPATPIISTSDGFDGTLTSREKQDTTQPTDSPKIETTTNANLDFTGYNYNTPSIRFPPIHFVGATSSNFNVEFTTKRNTAFTHTESASSVSTIFKTGVSSDGKLRGFRYHYITKQPPDHLSINTATYRNHYLTDGYTYSTPSVLFLQPSVVVNISDTSSFILTGMKTKSTVEGPSEQYLPSIKSNSGINNDGIPTLVTPIGEGEGSSHGLVNDNGNHPTMHLLDSGYSTTTIPPSVVVNISDTSSFILAGMKTKSTVEGPGEQYLPSIKSNSGNNNDGIPPLATPIGEGEGSSHGQVNDNSNVPNLDSVGSGNNNDGIPPPATPIGEGEGSSHGQVNDNGNHPTMHLLDSGYSTTTIPPSVVVNISDTSSFILAGMKTKSTVEGPGEQYLPSIKSNSGNNNDGIPPLATPIGEGEGSSHGQVNDNSNVPNLDSVGSGNNNDGIPPPATPIGEGEGSSHGQVNDNGNHPTMHLLDSGYSTTTIPPSVVVNISDTSSFILAGMKTKSTVEGPGEQYLPSIKSNSGNNNDGIPPLATPIGEGEGSSHGQVNDNSNVPNLDSVGSGNNNDGIPPPATPIGEGEGSSHGQVNDNGNHPTMHLLDSLGSDKNNNRMLPLVTPTGKGDMRWNNNNCNNQIHQPNIAGSSKQSVDVQYQPPVVPVAGVPSINLQININGQRSNQAPIEPIATGCQCQSAGGYGSNSVPNRISYVPTNSGLQPAGVNININIAL